MKKNKRSYILCLLIFVGIAVSSLGQEQENKPVMKKDIWEKETKSVDYGDAEYPKKKKPKESTELEKVDISDSSDSNIDIGFVQAIVFGLIILIVLYLLYLIFGNMVFQNTKVNREKRDFTLEEIEENLDEADLDTYIKKSLDNLDFRKAIRLHYLKIIKELSLKNWIQWQKDKTNFTYVGEMQARNEFNSFRDLTVAFEIVWYGEANILKEHFDRLDPIFNDFLIKLNKP